MKKALLCIALFCAITGYIYGDFAVDSTRSMSSTHMSAIRTACSGGSDVATYYWNEFIENDPTKTDSIFDETEKGWEDYFNSDLYVKYAMWGAVGLDMPVTTPPTTDSTLLDKAKYYLLDPYYEDYLNLDEVWDSLATNDDAGVNPWMRFITRNTALMVDMLWNYADSTDRVNMCSKLDSLADTLYYHLDRLKETWGLGEKPQFFGIAPGAAALGYAGCVLGDTTYINFAKNMIFDYQIPYLEESQTGYLDLFTTKANYIGEGTTYLGCNIYTQLAVFFTANLRMNSENLYNTELVKNTINNLQNMIAPDMQGIVLDDCYYFYSGAESNNSFIDGLFEYYYNNTNGDSDDWLRWYFNEYKDKYCYGNNYPSLELWQRYFYPIFSFNPYKNIDIDDSYTIPSTITGATHSDGELTTFRSEITDQEDFENSISMYVNYDNSLDPSFHEHSDQSSFQLFGLEKYLLIDTGYKSSGFSDWAHCAIHWHHSPYAHNLIIVNPDSLVEYTYLDHHFNGDPNTNDSLSYTYPLINPTTGKIWEPRYRNLVSPSNPQTVSCPNPSFRDYFITNNEIEKLRIYLDYEDDPIGVDTIRITRNYYFIDDNYFVIVDDVENTNPSSSNNNLYWNQLHFQPYTYSNENITIDGNNIFTLDSDDAYLYGTIGATSQFHNAIEEKMPWGGKQSKYRKHQRIRSVVEDKETSYITLLVPSESANNPITDVIDGDSYYAFEIYDTSKQPVEKSYYAVSDSLLDISFNDIDITSDAEFIGLTYRPGYQFATKVTQFIMADGDSVLYNDSLLVWCNSSVDEVIASYSGTELSVIVKSDDEYPQYRILRQGVDPDNFSSIGVANKENGTSNIKHLSYDSDYFYVNWYDFSTSPVYLNTSILVPYGDTLVIGNGVTVYCMNSGIKIEIEGEISIGDSVTFTSPDSVQWDGLYLYNTKTEIVIENVTFERGDIVCESPSLVIINSEFTNSDIEHYGYQLALEESDFSGCRIYCNWQEVKSPEQTEIVITGCTFSDYLGYPVYFTNYDYYELINNTITDCNGGFDIYSSGNKAYCTISNNSIVDNTNGMGIKLYSSYADIMGNNVINNNSYGIVGVHNSTISIIGNETNPLQMVYDNIHEEIVVDPSSYPDTIACNKIYDDSYTSGTPDQYLLRCQLVFYSERELDATNNYWGSASLNWDEWDGDDRFSPSDAFDYIPVWDPGTPREGGLEGAALLYAEADTLIKEEEYDDAKTIYQNIIDIYTLTDYAMYSMRNLLSLETISEHEFSSLRGYYLTDPKCNINEERTKLGKYLANYCTIELEEFPEAITFFEDIISDPDTELDSVYAVIDAGFTYLLMENEGKSSYIGKMAELKPKSEKEFRIMRDDLLTKLLGIVPTEPEEQNVEYTFELKHNYPNPFNSQTTISFSLPRPTHKAELKIYNIRGQLVRKFDINNKFGIGSISWDGQDSYGKKVGSGIYFYKLSADKKETIKKMVLMR